MKRPLVIAFALLVTSSAAVAQPVTSGGWRPPTNCSTNDLLKWNGTAWICSGGPAVTGSGSTNTIAIWASPSSIGNSGITDNGTSVSFNGRRLSSTNTGTGAVSFLSFGNTGSGVTASQTVLDFSSSATANTTSGAVTITGMSSVLFGTESAGSNVSTQLAALFTATGMDRNWAIRTNDGDNYFHSTSGSSGFGVTAGGTLSAKVHVAGTLLATGAVDFDSTLNVDGNLTFNGTTNTIGNATTDTIVATAHIPSTLTFASSTGPTVRGGTGAPEGAVTAVVGSIYLRSDGGAGTSFCVKESGSGNTGWVCK
jgi:hypothetical protein